MLMTLELGRALPDSRAETTYGLEFLRWFAEEAVRIGGRFSPSPAGNGRILVAHQPVGPCLAITPWNFPLAMGTRKIGPALAAGNVMLVKPARETPLTMLALARLLTRLPVFRGDPLDDSGGRRPGTHDGHVQFLLGQLGGLARWHEAALDVVVLVVVRVDLEIRLVTLVQLIVGDDRLHRALVDAGLVLDVHARQSDDVGHANPPGCWARRMSGSPTGSSFYGLWAGAGTMAGISSTSIGAMVRPACAAAAGACAGSLAGAAG